MGFVLLRPEPDGTHLAIGQASHAWLSGQLAAAWAPAVDDALRLAAEQHDVGMVAWDAAPPLDDAGLPIDFLRMELHDHLRLWTAAPHALETQSRHAALLVSLHGTGLYERRDLTRLTADDAVAVRGYLDGQRALQDAWAAELGLGWPQLRDEQRLLARWDALSLALCLGWDASTYDGIELTPVGGGAKLTPWPFGDRPSLEVRCEGRRLPTGAYVELRFTLTPGPLPSPVAAG